MFMFWNWCNAGRLCTFLKVAQVFIRSNTSLLKVHVKFISPALLDLALPEFLRVVMVLLEVTWRRPRSRLCICPLRAVSRNWHPKPCSIPCDWSCRLSSGRRGCGSRLLSPSTYIPRVRANSYQLSWEPLFGSSECKVHLNLYSSGNAGYLFCFK